MHNTVAKTIVATLQQTKTAWKALAVCLALQGHPSQGPVEPLILWTNPYYNNVANMLILYWPLGDVCTSVK